jgi:hypothetical protein
MARVAGRQIARSAKLTFFALGGRTRPNDTPTDRTFGKTLQPIDESLAIPGAGRARPGAASYVTIDPQLLVALEKQLGLARKAGIVVDTLTVMSGYRTPGTTRRSATKRFSPPNLRRRRRHLRRPQRRWPDRLVADEQSRTQRCRHSAEGCGVALRRERASRPCRWPKVGGRPPARRSTCPEVGPVSPYGFRRSF